VAGMPLPAGVAAVPCIWLVHRRADVYPDPHAFKPERWLGQRPGTATWFPFGGGVRRCIGAAFAELEMRIALQAIAQGVDLAPVSGEPERVTRRAITFTPHRGGAVRATRRNRSGATGVDTPEWVASSH
jgi:cytochrome P450 family 135